MKSNQIFFILTFVFLGQSLTAQECQGFFPFEPDTKLEMTYYDKKGRVSSVNSTIVNDLTETDGIIQAELTTTVTDKKGEELTTTEFEVTCKGDGYEIDITNMVSPMLMKSTYGMELEIEGDALIFPNDLSVGKKLEDASSTIEVRSGDVKLMTMTFDITNRKVEAKESVTTAAGTFDCYKLSYDFNSKLAFVKKKYRITQWIADGVGVVKEETYNKKGKLESSSELTKFGQ